MVSICGVYTSQYSIVVDSGSFKLSNFFQSRPGCCRASSGKGQYALLCEGLVDEPVEGNQDDEDAGYEPVPLLCFR